MKVPQPFRKLSESCDDRAQAKDEPTPPMKASLLYNLHSHNLAPGVVVDRNRFKEVYTSKNGKVRIFKVMSVSKESKEWVEKNKKCDAPV